MMRARTARRKETSRVLSYERDAMVWKVIGSKQEVPGEAMERNKKFCLALPGLSPTPQPHESYRVKLTCRFPPVSSREHNMESEG